MAFACRWSLQGPPPIPSRGPRGPFFFPREKAPAIIIEDDAGCNPDFNAHPPSVILESVGLVKALHKAGTESPSTDAHLD